MTNLEFILDYSGKDLSEMLGDAICSQMADCEVCPFREENGDCLVNEDISKTVGWLIAEYRPSNFVLTRLKKYYPRAYEKIQEFRKAYIDNSVFTYNMSGGQTKDDEIIFATIGAYLMGLQTGGIISPDEEDLLSNYILGKETTDGN